MSSADERRSGEDFIVRSLSVTYRDGYDTRTHSHPWAQLIHARRGLMQVTSEAQTWFVPPTSGVWIPPRVEHQILARGEVALRTLYIAEDCARRAGRDLGAFEVVPLLSELILHVLGQDMLNPEVPEHARLAGVLIDLIAAASPIDTCLPLPRDPRALKLAERLRRDPADRRDLEALAADAGASLRTLQRCFAVETGLTIEAWRRKARLVHAAADLADGASVSDAALDCGYDSQSAFSAAFRRQFGVTPKRFERGRA